MPNPTQLLVDHTNIFSVQKSSHAAQHSDHSTTAPTVTILLTKKKLCSYGNFKLAFHSFQVNPGRKASLSGIREGDVISSINGRPTKSMSNADAHAMLRSAGPVLRLGLNE